jgi:integrase
MLTMNFEPCIRYFNKNGYANVYIRVVYKRKVAYIRQNALVNKSQVRGGDIKDVFVITKLASVIQKYIDRTNFKEFSTVSDVVRFLETGTDASFTDYYKEFVKRMSRDGRDKSSLNYICAYNSFSKYIGSDIILFSDITSVKINLWVDSLRNSKIAKNKYPTHLKTIFNSGKNELNDYDNDIILIKHDPFAKVKIPAPDLTEHRAVEIDILNKLFDYRGSGRAELARDVSLIIFCLAGINTADLYDMQISSLQWWKLCYRRKKTRSVRNKAYMEITIPELIRPLINKYKGSDRLFNFSDRYSTPDDFSKAVNKGLKVISEELKLPHITTYTLRHSWATIADNIFGETTDFIGFCLIHTGEHKVTEKYIKKKFEKVDKLNKKITDLISQRSL